MAAADDLSNAFDTSVHDPHAPSAQVQQARNQEKRRQVLIANWDPSYPEEKVNWYQDFVQRHAEPKLGWFEGVGRYDEDQEAWGRREATGAGILFDPDGMADKLVAPLEDGSIHVWDARARSKIQGKLVAKSGIGLLSDVGDGTQLPQSIMTDTGAVECVSIDSKLRKGFFAVQQALNEVDLNTLQIVSRTPYPFSITALSEAHHRTPLTVGTTYTVHLHDTRKPPRAPSSTRHELLNRSADDSFSRLGTGDFGGHASLSQPGALSILHLPTSREWDGNGDIWVGGRFTSMLNYDRRFFPRLRGTVHSGARLSCITAIPYPFVPHDLRLGRPYSSPALLRDAKALPGHTMIVAGEYKGKGSLELYGLSSEPTRGINSSDSRTTSNHKAYYQNRQTASSTRLLSVAPHGTRLVFSDGGGNLKWVERDGSTPVRQFNISDFERLNPNETTSQHLVNPHPEGASGGGDIVQKILPTVNHSLHSPFSSSLATSSRQDELFIWTSDGRLGKVEFGSDSPFDADVFEDALEEQVTQAESDKVREREYSEEMRRALEHQARELRWMRGYGL